MKHRRVAGSSFSQAGFTLIELLVVMVIIAVIMAIAIPNLVDAKKAANEASAISSVRNISTAQRLYANTLGVGQFAASLGVLGSAKLLDSVLAGGKKSGYLFAMTTSTGDFAITAVPEVVGKTGYRGFYTDGTGVIRYSPDGSVPTSTSPPIPR